MSDCKYDFKRGWWCSREWRHEGACALRPYWWNFRAFWNYYWYIIRFERETRSFWCKIGHHDWRHVSTLTGPEIRCNRRYCHARTTLGRLRRFDP